MPENLENTLMCISEPDLIFGKPIASQKQQTVPDPVTWIQRGASAASQGADASLQAHGLRAEHALIL